MGRAWWRLRLGKDAISEGKLMAGDPCCSEVEEETDSPECRDLFVTGC